jgi:hypothetical protein
VAELAKETSFVPFATRSCATAEAERFQKALMPAVPPNHQLVHGLCLRTQLRFQGSDVPDGRVFVVIPLPPRISRQSRAMSNAMRTLFHLAG